MPDLNRQAQHPGIGEIEAVRTGEALEDVKEHVEDCVHCRGLLRELDALAGEIKARQPAPAIVVPAEVDAAVLSMMHNRASKIKGRRRVFAALLRPAWAAAAAAAVVLAFGLWHTQRRSAVDHRAATQPVSKVHIPMDIDDSGKVDIIDAYHMARALKQSKAAPLAWDFTSDGRVDDADVALVARRAVAVSGEGI